MSADITVPGPTASSVTIHVATSQPYDVRVGHGVRTFVPEAIRPGARAAILHPAVLHDAAVAMAAALAGPVLVEVPDAEAAKTPQVLDDAWRRLAQAGFTRSDTVIGLGGGATTDLAGFVAATWNRGVDYICVPTTVLAMADAAVGGKTGVNIPEGKNLVGAFWQPSAVICDLDYAATLPQRDVSSGLAEILKAGFIADPRILHQAKADWAEARDPASARFAHLLAATIAVKAGVVAADPRETNETGATIGRTMLNYGHTLAHAIEQHEGYRWRHGEAVAVGMVYAAEVARRLGLLDDTAVALHRAVLDAAGLPTTYDGDWATLRPVMGLDKKARGSHLRLVLLDGLFHPVLRSDIDEGLLADAFAALRPTSKE